MNYLKKIKKGIITTVNREEFKKNNKQKTFFYISAFPKSGSSFISLVLKDLLRIDLVDLINSHYGEQDLYEPKLIKYLQKKTITKHHTLASKPNIDLFIKYDIKPIILTRNLPDTIVSLRDHLSRTLIWPHFHVPNNFNSMSIAKQYDFLIDFATPWYIHFFSSWKNVEKQNVLEIKFIQYENFHNDKVSAIKEILEFWKFNFSEKEIIKSINYVEGLSEKQNRVNKAIMNRGKKLLTEQQLEKLRVFTKYYEDIDFSPIHN